jgi:hypothetical protein
LFNAFGTGGLIAFGTWKNKIIGISHTIYVEKKTGTESVCFIVANISEHVKFTTKQLNSTITYCVENKKRSFHSNEVARMVSAEKSKGVRKEFQKAKRKATAEAIKSEKTKKASQITPSRIAPKSTSPFSEINVQMENGDVNTPAAPTSTSPFSEINVQMENGIVNTPAVIIKSERYGGYCLTLRDGWTLHTEQGIWFCDFH